MKKITIQVDLEDNEVFDEAVEEALKGRAKQIARETLESEMKRELERIVAAKIDKALQNPRLNLIGNQVVVEIAKQVKRDIQIDDEQIHSALEVQVAKMLEGKAKNTFGSIARHEDRLEAYLQQYLDRSLASILHKNTLGET